VGGVERGERNLALINIEKIALAFEVSLAELFRGVSSVRFREVEFLSWFSGFSQIVVPALSSAYFR
jgi:hypothetical protein